MNTDAPAGAGASELSDVGRIYQQVLRVSAPVAPEKAEASYLISSVHASVTCPCIDVITCRKLQGTYSTSPVEITLNEETPAGLRIWAFTHTLCVLDSITILVCK